VVGKAGNWVSRVGTVRDGSRVTGEEGLVKMSFVRTLLDQFWNPDVWLPPNVTWADFEPNDKIAYADHRHLAISLPFAIVLLCVRFVLER
jgi:hypothetical protein